jgi:hypothetical protein
MAKTTASTVGQYLKDLPADRRSAISAVRRVVLDNLPTGYDEMIDWGAITYAIPLTKYSDTYNGKPLCVAALSAGKNYCSLHLMAVYGHAPTRIWFEEQYKQSGRKLDMGKACVRFKTPEDLPLDVIAKVIARVPPDTYIKTYEESRRK